mmetsp:Transcript_138220/g.441666  ORF Transcript_138220/g.441666 Transcript_138220/m.441666 type:complete len:284 (+) Transcript_138220:464-1315(+)
MNLGEDYGFLQALRMQHLTPVSMKRPRSGVSLLFDSYGICVHTLHPRSTSNNWAQREVTRQELEDMDIADLSEDLVKYVLRFPAKESTSRFIEGKIERRQWKLRVVTAVGEFSVRCTAGVRAQDVKELLAKQLGSMGRDAPVFRMNSSGEAKAEGPPMEATERVGLRAEKLFADLRLADRASEIKVTVTDMKDRSISVVVRLPHSSLQLQSVREAVVVQHGVGDFGAEGAIKKAAREIRLAECSYRGASFMAVDATRWLGDSREFWSPGLAELLCRKRAPDCE